MQKFIAVNALGIFSLIILAVVFFQASIYLDNKNAKLKKIWLLSISSAFAVQLMSVIYRSMAGVQGNSGRICLYITYFLIFSFIAAMSANFALFIDYCFEFSNRKFRTLKRIFAVFVLVNSVMALLSIPFGFYFMLDESNNYVRGNLVFISGLLTFLPLLIVIFGAVFKSKNRSMRALILTGVTVSTALCALQFLNIVPFPLVLPSITVFILIINSVLTINSMYIEYLTGLKNMRGVDKYFGDLPQTLDNYLIVLYIDFNQFKRINDMYGHKEGDSALCVFSKILLRNLKADDLAARIGGDEFLIVTKLNKPNNVKLIIKKIKNEVNKFNANTTKPYKLSISYGYSINPPGVIIDKDRLIDEADKKMYEDKMKSVKRKASREAL